MSQLLQVHIANQRLLKSTSGENSPASPGMIGSPGTLSPLSFGPSSPQGMPIPRRIGQDQQHWVTNSGLMLNGNLITGPGNNIWNTAMMNADPNVESPLGIPVDPLSMEGELSKLSMAVDEDDIFKMEKHEILGPTLAELNAPDADTLLDGLNFDDLYWPVDPGSNGLAEATPSPQTPAGGNPLDPDGDIVSFQVQPSSSFPPLGNHKLMGTIASSVPTTSTILEQTLLQPTLTMASEVCFSMQPSSPHPATPTTNPLPSRYT